jgi:DNA-binding SARP family transcriptional activator
MVLLKTFGGISVESDCNSSNDFAIHPSRLAVLAVLAVCDRDGVSRDRLCNLLWSERSTERARGSLKQALFTLRRDLSERDLTTGKTILRLNTASVSCDVMDFELARRAGDLRRVVNLYDGPFLDGVHIKESPEFSRWVDRHRDRLAQAFRCSVETLACEAEQKSDFSDAVSWWSRISESDPFSSRIAMRHIKALVAADDREGAIRHGARYQSLVRAELDAEPDERVGMLLAQLRRSPRFNVS